MNAILLKPGREKSVLRRHPWIFSGAVAQTEGKPQAGETVLVRAADGRPLAQAAYSPHSQIRGRIWTWDPAQVVDADFLRARLQRAAQTRADFLSPQQTNAFRLVHAESDRLPGLIVDRYADTVVMQCLSAGAERWRSTFADLLAGLPGVARVYERSDVDVRQLEGLPPRRGPLHGTPPPERLRITENGLQFWVDVIHGHKTGFYLDQRANRQLVRDMAAGKSVLNCFAYTGGFAVYALAGGAQQVVSVDESPAALALGEENVRLNGFDPARADWIRGDAFRVLRRFRDQGRQFDLIVLDPPKFASTPRQAQRAARGYKDINLLAFKLLRPGGLLFTFSCSGGVSGELFQKIVAGAALDAAAEAQIVGRMTQGPDHPVALNFPEGAYLKGLVVVKK